MLGLDFAIMGRDAVVVGDVVPFTVGVGVPARQLKVRWSCDQILAHEAALYPVEKRLSRSFIEQEIVAG